MSLWSSILTSWSAMSTLQFGSCGHVVSSWGTRLWPMLTFMPRARIPNAFLYDDVAVNLGEGTSAPGGRSHVKQPAVLFQTSCSLWWRGHHAVHESHVPLGLPAGTAGDVILFSDVWQIQHLRAPLRQGCCYCILSPGSTTSSCQVPSP